MSLLNKHIYQNLLSLILVGILLTNVFMTIKPALGSPGLTLKWMRNLGTLARTTLAPLAADLVGDNRLEIVVVGGSTYGGDDGTVTVLNGTTGSVIWQVAPGGIGTHSGFDIADLNKDGIPEIIISAKNPLVLHGNNGSVYWRNTNVPAGDQGLYNAVYDIDGDGYPTVFVSSGQAPWQGYDYITSLSYDGQILHQAPSWHPCYGGLTVGDANFDGRYELYQGDRRYGYSLSTPYVRGEWGVRALDAHTLTLLWNDSSVTTSSQCPILADVDKDGILDVVVANQAVGSAGLCVYNAVDGSVVTTGGKYRKSLNLGLSAHSQLTVYDIDGDGNLEAIVCRNSNPKIWDLYDWKLDAVLPIVCFEPPKVGDVTGDGQLDIIAVASTGSDIYVYDKTYAEVDHVTGLIGACTFTLVQDVDGDGYNELVVSSQSGRVYCYDTPAQAPTPRVRTEGQFYSEYNRGAAEYVSPPGPQAPQINEPSPTNGATNIPITLSQLSFKLTDYQHDPINYTVTTIPDIGTGSGINVPNEEYTVPISNLHYSTTYTWTVTATDGTHTTTKTFTFTTSDLPPWWNINWQYRREITIDHTKVSSDQINFPVLIDLTDSGLTTKAQPDGDDFVFTDSNHNKINHEIELYDNTTGHLIAWVNVSFLSSTTDTILYLYYGNPTCETQQNTTAVWDTHYKMVLHLDEKTSIHYDSTVNGNNGTPLNGVAQGVAGKIDGADTLDGVNDYIEVPHSNTLTGYTEAFTASFWLKLDDVSRRQAILNKYNTAGNQRGWFIEYQNHVTYGKVLGFFASQDGATYRGWYTAFNPTVDTWYYITIVWESNSVPKFYINGVQGSTINTGTVASIYNNVGAPLHIGRSTYNTARYLQGSLDQICISNPARSASYILTCYNNQKDPSTFYTIGPEETFEEPESPVVSDPYPPDNTIGVELNPTLSVKIIDYQGDLMTIIFSTNASGTWQNIGSHTNVGNGIYNQTTTKMDSYDTTYWWKVQVTDGTNWTNRTYSFTTKPESSAWWNTDWQYRRVITIDPSKVSSDQTDFPVVIDVTDSSLTGKTQSDGDDFVFTDADNVKLDHEIESYDYTTGHLIAWVNVPYVSSTAETVLYMYYGNSEAPNQENPPAVWDTSNKLVLHLSEPHECRFWGMIADSLPHDVVLDHLISDPSSLKVLGGSNRDGWALAYYNSLDPNVLRGYPPANTDPNFDLAANEMADSGAWIGVGHVRARSQGAIPEWGNPHPFMRYKGGKWWAFGHNGNLNKDILKSLIGPEYLAANPPKPGTDWDDPDVVDSDLYGLYVLKCIEANNWNATLGIAQAITDITELDSGAANFFLTDGETLWGFRRGNTLWYYYQATPPQYSAIASQPPDSAQPGWVQLTDYNLITLTKNNPPSIIPDIRQEYPLLVDSELNDSVDSVDLRYDSPEQDWYESRDDLPTLLFLDTSDVGGNNGKKAGFTADSSKNAYLSQEFSSPQAGTFSVQWDIYVDSILNKSPYRAGQMMIGADSGSGPNRDDDVRFVFLAFYKDGGAMSGTADLVAMLDFDTQVLVTSDLNLDQWYTIKVDVDVAAGTYDVYLDGAYIDTVDACTALASLTHISFAQWNDGAGAFYVDNVFAPAGGRYKLTISTEGNGSVTVDPTESSYANGAEVTLTAVPDSGWMFSTWKSDASGSDNPIVITMDSDKTVIANFTTMLLMDSEFNDSVDSNDLRNDTAGQDWYESRNDLPTLLFLDETDVGGNAGKKAGFTADSTKNAYLTQEFSSPQAGTFTVRWDIYVDSILDISSPDRAGFMLIGADLDASGGPNRNDPERFVYLAFYKDGGATSGPVDLVAMSGFSSFTAIASGLNLQEWHTIKVVVDVVAGTYDVYVDGVFAANVAACTPLASVTHISFAQWNDGAGAFYVDNVFAPAVDRYKLTINVIGNGSVTVDPAESTYASGTEVDLTAIADSGWIFSSWSNDLTGSANPTTITMDSDKVVTATFTEPQYTLTVNIVGSGSVTKNPDKSTYAYGEAVNLTASPSVDWSFFRWSGDLSGSDNPATIIMDGDKVVTARFIQGGTCIDSTVHGNDGVLYGGVIQGVAGKIDGAYEFDGVDDYIEVLHSNTLSGFTEAFTASFWLKLDDTTRRQTILNKYNTASNQRGWFIEFQNHAYHGKVLGFFASSDGLTYREWYGSFNPAAGTWYYITVIWEANTVPKFYVDGVQVSTINSGTIASIFNNVDVPLHIGRSTYAAGRYLRGSLDEIRLSNPARSADYILTCYNNQKDPSTFYQVGLEETVATEPIVSDPYPADEATNVPITLTELSFNLTDYQGDLMDYYISTYPDIGSDSATGISDGRYTVAVSGLQYQTTYTWHLNVTDGTEWTNRTYTFTTLGELLVDPEFNDSVDSVDLRYDSPEQDWYESRDDVPTLLFLDESDVGGNTGKKAGFAASASGNAYCSQEFRLAQTGTFTVQWDIYVDSILNVSPYRAGQMLIGIDSGSSPNRNVDDRFVFLAFYKNGGAMSGTADLVAMLDFNTQITVASDLNLDQWYTIKVDVDVAAGTYDVYVDDVFKATVDACKALSSVTHISFAQWNDGAGAFYVDNVYGQAEKPPTVSSPEPADGASDIPVSTSLLNFTISDAEGDHMDYYLSTIPDVGSDSALGVLDGTYSLPVSGLEAGTSYTWWVNVTDGTHWTNATFTFTTEGFVGLLVDSEFNDSTDSTDLRANNATAQDWYESRAQVPTLLFLDESDVGDNAGKKAGFTASASGNAYLTQEFSSAQTGTFTVQWDIYIDSILSVSPYRAGIMMIGRDSGSGPNRLTGDRFAYMAFSKPGGGTDGTMDLVAPGKTTIATGLNLDQWYTIKVIVDVAAGTYDVYIDGVFTVTVDANAVLATVTHISFAQWNDGAGAFYVDNVFAPPQERHKLTVNIVGSGTVEVSPAESTYANGTVVTLTAVPADGWTFSGWSGDLAGIQNPVNITMNGNKNVTATFTEIPNTPPEASNLSISPEYPTTTDDLVADYTYYDAEDDPEIGTEIRWYKNGVLQHELNDTLTVPSSYTSKGEVWNFTVRPKDGKDFGELKTSPSVTIMNSPPSITSVEITPDPAFNTSTLTATPSGWFDADDDTEGYVYQWQKWNGTAWENITGATAQTLDSQYFVKGDQIKVVCTPFDGETYGTPQETTITISNSPPAIDDYYPPTDPVISEGESQIFNITYSDPDNDVESVLWFVNATQDGEGDNYTFVADYESEGTYNITAMVQDNSSAYDAKTWILTVHGTNRPPIITSYTPENEAPTVYEGENLNFTHTSSDPDNDPLYYTWLLDSTEVAYTQNWTYSPNYNASGYHNVTLKVSDGQLFNSTQWNVTVINVNQAPIIDSWDPLADSIAISENQNQTFTITYHDPDEDSLTVQWFVNGTLNATGDTFTFNATFGSAGKYNITVVVTDPSLATATHTWTLTVHHVNRQPVIETYTPEDLTPEVNEGESLNFTHTSSDPDNDTLTYQWLLDGDFQSASQNWTYTPNYESAGGHNVTLTVSDGSLTVSQQWNVTVIDVNRPPEIISHSPEDLTPEVNEAESLEFTQVSTDPDGDPLFYKWLLDSEEQATTQNWTYSPGYEAAGYHNVTLTVSDSEFTRVIQWNVTVINVNRLPTASDLSISPPSPTTTDDLIGSYSYSDIDGDPDEGTEIRWYKNGVLQSGLNDTLVVPSGLTSKGEVWNFTVRPKDGMDFGELQVSPSVTIQNSPPTIDDYYPATDPTILEGESQEFNITYHDPDGDTVTVQWYLNNTPTATTDSYTFNAGAGSEGTYNVTVVISDTSAQALHKWTLTVTTANTPPEASNLLIVPSSPSTNNDLIGIYDYYDADGDLESDSEIRWYNNDILQHQLNNTLTISSSYTSKSEVWYFTVKPKDGKHFGTLQTSPTITIQNSVPSITGVEITPDPAYNTTTLNATPVGWFDADEDSENYRYQWQKFEGGSWRTISGETSQTLSPQYFVKGDQIKVTSIPYDGEAYGTPQQAAITISNSPPNIDSFTPTETNPEVHENNTLAFTHTSSDLDNDPLTYSWSLDGTEEATTQNWNYTPSFNEAGFHNVTLLVSDGQLTASVQWDVTVIDVNRLPSAPVIEITPAEPSTEDNLLCAITTPSIDPDGDPITYTYQWYKNDTLQTELTTDTVPYHLTSKGELWKCVVTPFDGKDYGPSAEAEVTIQNTPPTIDEYYPPTDQTILEGESQEFNVTHSDADDDPITVQWYLNGAPTTTADFYTFTADYTSAGTYNVTVTVSDDSAEISHEWILTVIDVGPTLDMPFTTDESPTAVDYSGYGNNGTINEAIWTNSGDGSYYFDGFNDYILIPDSESLDGGGTWTEITIEFWIRPTIYGKGVRLIEKRSAGSSYQVGFQTTPSPGISGNQLYWNVWTSVAYKEIVAPFGLEMGKWSHVVCTYKDGVGMIIYVNGTVSVSASHSGTIKDSTCPLNIGRYGVGSSYFTGLMDDIRIYIISLPEPLILQNYNESKDAHSNLAPTIDSFSPTDTTPEVNEGEALEFTHTSSDPDFDQLTYSWLLDDIEQATTQNWTYSPDYEDAGTHNVTLIVSDGELSVSQEWNVTVIDVNRPPTIDTYYPLTNPTISEEQTQEFNITYSDPDGDPLTIKWYLNGTSVANDTDSYIFTATTGSAGTYNITVVVSDGSAQTSQKWTLTVVIGNLAPEVSNPEPSDLATDVPVSTPLLNFTISDANDDSMDYYVSTSPNIGSDNQTGVTNGTYSLSVSGLVYGTEYKWWVNVTDGTQWTNTSFTFTTEQQLLVDSEFNDSADSDDLRADGDGQDWYESRDQDKTLLTLDTDDVGGNSGNKTRLSGGTSSSTDNVYLSQEFSSLQTGVFTVQWDIYVDEILNIGAPDRSGWMLIGDESHASSPGPNSDNSERFVYMAFFRDGGGTSGTMDLVARDSDDGWTSFTTVASGLNLKQWYTIKVVCNLTSDTYDVYVDGEFKLTVAARNAKTSVTHISFAQWHDGAGTFYVDNVSSPAQQTNGGGGYPAANSSNHTSTSYTANTQYLPPVFLLPAIPVAFSVRKNKRKRK